MMPTRSTVGATRMENRLTMVSEMLIACSFLLSSDPDYREVIYSVIFCTVLSLSGKSTEFCFGHNSDTFGYSRLRFLCD
jgi:hypothetical protein